MEDMKGPPAAPLAHQPSPRQRSRRWLRIWSIALSLTVVLGVGAFLGTTLGASRAQAAPGASGVDSRLTPTVWPGTPGTPGPCGGEVTVSHVTDKAITVTRSDGSTATIYITGHTHYMENGHSVTLSAVKAGSKVYVVGTCNNQGRVIKATSIEIVP